MEQREVTFVEPDAGEPGSGSILAVSSADKKPHPGVEAKRAWAGRIRPDGGPCVPETGR